MLLTKTSKMNQNRFSTSAFIFLLSGKCIRYEENAVRAEAIRIINFFCHGEPFATENNFQFARPIFASLFLSYYRGLTIKDSVFNCYSWRCLVTEKPEGDAIWSYMPFFKSTSSSSHIRRFKLEVGEKIELDLDLMNPWLCEEAKIALELSQERGRLHLVGVVGGSVIVGIDLSQMIKNAALAEEMYRMPVTLTFEIHGVRFRIKKEADIEKLYEVFQELQFSKDENARLIEA